MAVVKFHEHLEDLPLDTVIWKYYSLSKFMWLLENQKIFMCCTDDFKDKGELPATKVDAKGHHMTFEKLKSCLACDRRHTYVSSWILSNHEMALMWDSYASSNEGIAIKTTIGDLIKSCHPEDDVYIGAVRYINPQVESVQIPGKILNMLRYSLTKRNLFEQEQEFRMIYMDEDREHRKNDIKIDCNVSCDINSLIQEIHIGPDAPNYYIDLIKLIIRRYDLTCEVKRSELLL